MRELRAILRTPAKVVFDGPVDGVRWPSPSGQAGTRPGAEPFVSVLMPGLVVLGRGEGRRFGGTAGGVVRHDGAVIELFSPFVEVGAAEEVLAALARAQTSEEGELAALRRLEELEHRITVEVRSGALEEGAS
ncbi:MAG: hypothetical protein H6737_27770 [Alphaproteobacteria bacterium]|nr:hypothetical protein [Alphaproteobacteria bacterium]